MISATKGYSMKLWSRNKIRPAFVFLLACCASANVSAQDITEVVPLSFGEIVIPSFASVARVTISPSGGFNTNSNVYLLSNPQRGEYTVSGAPPNTFYTISVPASIVLVGPGSVTFTLDNLAATPGPPYQTDALGNDNFFISGRLQSQGGGVNYFDGTYDSNLPITLIF